MKDFAKVRSLRDGTLLPPLLLEEGGGVRVAVWVYALKVAKCLVI
jgi:hypothetical protein